MVSSVYSGAINGIGGYLVTVEVDMAEGLPCIDLVGFLGSEVKESAGRIRVALKNSGYHMPSKRFTVNLSPAGIRKGGSAFDLPIAIGMIQAMGMGQEEFPTQRIFMAGELGLDGTVRSIRGILPLLLEAKEQGIKFCIIPRANEKEGEWIKGLQILGVGHLTEVSEILCSLSRTGKFGKVQKNRKKKETDKEEKGTDFSQIIGQAAAKRAAEIAAAGFHNLLLVGPPGTGKSMIASAIPGILPPMDEREMLETSRIYSVAGLLHENCSFITKRPFLNPHSNITPQALTGGGNIPRPGVLSLANHGVLFLDELPEFKRQNLELLRQPLEERNITIARKSGSFVYPCDFMLVGAMNPCPCGFYPDRNRCRCSERDVQKYLGRISGPFLDRIDLSVGVFCSSYEQLQEHSREESSKSVRKRVVQARMIQKERNQDGAFNGRVSPEELLRICDMTREAKEVAGRCYTERSLSLRGYHRLLRTARTIADLEASGQVKERHIYEASAFRVYDRIQ
ncbi:MAG: YifB family Mg chelatase-like AAA ATPase [Lachnospiraceae bacterium]|nr:YifB family Mg chelatase-like AAA ATPase [Lachnospiraceae bacterium]